MCSAPCAPRSRWFGFIFATVTLACLVPTTGKSQVSGTSATPLAGSSGEQIYQANCATCHGQDGRGTKPENTGLDLPIRDFSDCAFTSRETERDWGGIVSQGGPIRAFDERMPAFGFVLTEVDIERVVRYTKQFCRDTSWPPGELNFPRAILTEKAFPENELLLISGVTLEGPVAVAGKLIYEQRIGARSQFEVIAPFGVYERTEDERRTAKLGRWGRGLKDVAFGFKHVIFHSPHSETIASLGAEFAIPTGSPAEGMGNGTYVFEPFITVGQGLSALGFVQLQGGLGLPFDEAKSSKELYGRVVLGRMFTYGRYGRFWVPMFEFQSVRELASDAVTGLSFMPQIQLAISKRKHVRANFGVLMPLNDLATQPTQAMGYLLWDWYDGGLNEGW